MIVDFTKLKSCVVVYISENFSLDHVVNIELKYLQLELN